MSAPARLGLYGLLLVAVFVVAAFAANAIVPDETVQRWVDDTEHDSEHDSNRSGGSGHEHSE